MPERREPLGHHRDAVALLDPQLGGAGQQGLALGAGGGDEQGREFVDGQRHLIHRDLDAAQGAARTRMSRHRLGTEFALVARCEVRAHRAQDVDDADPGRVHAHLLQGQVRARRDAGAHQKEGGRRDIRRHRDGRRA
jgi:hypothetical protein